MGGKISVILIKLVTDEFYRYQAEDGFISFEDRGDTFAIIHDIDHKDARRIAIFPIRNVRLIEITEE